MTIPDGYIPRIGDKWKSDNHFMGLPVGTIGVIRHIEVRSNYVVHLELNHPTGYTREGCRPGYGWKANISTLWKLHERVAPELPPGGDWE